MRIKAIPKHLLIHEAKVERELLNEWQQPAGLQLIANLTHIRVEPSAALKLDAKNQEVRLQAVLFYDAVGSRPRDVQFEPGQRVTVNGAIYHVANVDLLYAEQLHHVEVGLI